MFTGKYITYDEGVVHTLTQLRDANKRTFLLTNSFWNYTNAIMDYVVHGGYVLHIYATFTKQHPLQYYL